MLYSQLDIIFILVPNIFLCFNKGLFTFIFPIGTAFVWPDKNNITIKSVGSKVTHLPQSHTTGVTHLPQSHTTGMPRGANLSKTFSASSWIVASFRRTDCLDRTVIQERISSQIRFKLFWVTSLAAQSCRSIQWHFIWVNLKIQVFYVFCTSLNGNNSETKYRISADDSSGLVKLAK